ncbi:hypothetical protein [Desulfovibrio sp. JC010]|uniref:hypothetical protein n=1 Tax=Desulfovibrio sp. JC010 TaxID=2593641 RepID=UPI0013D6A403|nr:hypothetical protein [Desulfovibrio sp. JC010]NDV25080.1 hypothetical protein [Desulfovibrio sp. JC010]
MLYSKTTPASGIKTKIAFSAALLAIAGLFFIPYREIRLERIRAFGENKVIGIVIEKNSRIGEHNFKEETNDSQTIRYRFIDPSGLPRERTATVQNSFWRRISQGDSVVVYYAKAAPRVSRIEHEKEDAVVRLLAKFSRGSTH